MVEHAFIPSTREAKTGGSLEFEGSQVCIVTLSQKNRHTHTQLHVLASFYYKGSLFKTHVLSFIKGTK